MGTNCWSECNLGIIEASYKYEHYFSSMLIKSYHQHLAGSGKTEGTGEIAQQLRVLTALTENRSLVPNTGTKQLTTAL